MRAGSGHHAADPAVRARLGRGGDWRARRGGEPRRRRGFGGVSRAPQPPTQLKIPAIIGR